MNEHSQYAISLLWGCLATIVYFYAILLVHDRRWSPRAAYRRYLDLPIGRIDSGDSPLSSKLSLMKYRKLRIAWSVAWGVICVMLIALWVRGQANALTINTRTSQYNLAPQDSVLIFFTAPATQNRQELWLVETVPIGLSRFGAWTFLVMPYPLLAIPSAVVIVVPWIPRRFGLRTFLIATTVFAVLLGAIIWATK
jgi:hypothetical protein